MGAYSRVVLLGIVMLVAPFAAASDPLQEQTCIDDDHCAGAGSCVADLGCVPRGCEPVTDCSGDLNGANVGCVVNATIDGRTCQYVAGITFDDTSSDSGIYAGVQITNGSVEAFNLVNSWMAPGVEASFNLFGIDLGWYYVGLYRSDILTEGPRGGPYGMIAPSDNHTWTQVGVVYSHSGGPDGGEDLLVAVELLDYMPDGCFVRQPASQDVACPSLHELYP